MNKVWIVLAALLMSACVGGEIGRSPPAVYDFGLPAAGPANGGKWRKFALEIRSPSWFDSFKISYRLAYDAPLKRYEYATSRWAGTPAALLAQSLNQQLGTANINENTAYDCALRVDLQEFSQVFDTPQQSRGVLQAGVQLVDAKRQTISERRISIDRPAASPDALGGVKALVEASTELGGQLSSWLDGLDGNGALGGCRAR